MQQTVASSSIMSTSSVSNISAQLAAKRLNGSASNKTAVQQQVELIGAIDQGTSSTRFLVFENETGRMVASSQIEVKRIVPKEGWVEMDPMTIMKSVYDTISSVAVQLQKQATSSNQDQSGNPTLKGMNQLKCVGICNQRESTVVWDALTGRPLYNAIVWMDNRTKDLVDDMIELVPGRDFNWLKDKTGLPMSTYFSAFKLKWLIDNVQEVKLASKENRLLFGTVDTWILWNLTGNHMTDVTNASRTFLMDIETLEWDKTLCKYFNIPMNILPRILSSADDFGLIRHGPLQGLPITGVIGDQSGALFGHNCIQLGQTKATFGTGCFIMQNIGSGPLNEALSGVQRSAKRGLITTVGYKLRDRPVCYALEGSIKIAGAAITWLRDNLQLIEDYSQCDQLVNNTTNSAGVFFVPALGGLYSPYWDPNAAGTIIGLSQFTRREHLVRATFDSIAFQTNDILSLMRGVTSGLMIDGGLCKSDNMCQILADITGCDIVRPSMCETSALGAAMVAGFGAGIWPYESMLAESRSSQDECASSINQNHHYPHESLHYEEKFSSLIESKKNDIQLRQQVPEHSACDDAGGGRLATSYEGGGLASDGEEQSDSDDGSDESQPISSDMDYYLQSSGEFEGQPKAEGVQAGSAWEVNGAADSDGSKLKVQRTRHTPSSGYNSTDCELSAVEQRIRHDTPSSELTSSSGERCLEDDDTTTTSTIRSKSPADERNDRRRSQPEDHFAIKSLRGKLRSPRRKPDDVFQSYISLEHRTELVETWRLAVERSMKWTKIHHEEIRRIDYQRLSSLPISMYLFFSIGMVALSGLMSAINGRGFLAG